MAKAGSGLATLTPQKVATAHATVTDALRSAIVRGELLAGTRLVQSELASALGVSITPVREALRDLATEGLVNFDAFRGAVVHQPTAAQLAEIYAIRTALVPMAVAEGVRHATAADLQFAHGIIDKMEDEEDQVRWIELNRELHHCLDALGAGPQLVSILVKLADLSALYVNLALPLRDEQLRGADREHRLLCQAYEAGDVEVAVQRTLEHLDSTLSAARSKLEEPPEAATPS